MLLGKKHREKPYSLLMIPPLPVTIRDGIQSTIQPPLSVLRNDRETIAKRNAGKSKRKKKKITHEKESVTHDTETPVHRLGIFLPSLSAPRSKLTPPSPVRFGHPSLEYKQMAHRPKEIKPLDNKMFTKNENRSRDAPAGV